MAEEVNVKKIIVSGGFDPIHKGHIDYICDAAKHGPVFVILNSDEWLMRKKGYVFMHWDERCHILKNIKGVDRVFSVDDSDGTVCAGIEDIYKHECMNIAFAKGGDRGPDNTPEKELCERLGIEVLWRVGGDKVQSSSDLVNNVRNS